MSHFTVMVIGENPEEQLAPYQENNMGNCPEEYLAFNDETESLKISWNELTEEERSEYGSFGEFAEDEGYKEHEGKYGYWENPNAKWDWYLLGGRWSGFLKLKEGAEGEVGQGGLFSKAAKDGTADSAFKKDVDFFNMRKDAAEEAGKLWDKVNDIIKGCKEPLPWKHVRENMFPGDIDGARDYYRNQEASLKLSEWNKVNNHELFGIDLEDFNCTREDYCIDAANGSFVTFAVLKNGQWYERGQMGWWASVSNEKDRDDWNAEVAKMINELPEDTRISIYDCHI